MRPPQTIWSLCAFIWIDRSKFCYPRTHFLYYGHPSRRRSQLVFYSDWCVPFPAQRWLLNKMPSSKTAHRILKSRRPCCGGKDPVCSASRLDQLEYKDICKLAGTTLPMGYSMLLLLRRAELYGQKHLVLAKAVYRLSAPRHLPRSTLPVPCLCRYGYHQVGTLILGV